MRKWTCKASICYARLYTHRTPRSRTNQQHSAARILVAERGGEVDDEDFAVASWTPSMCQSSLAWNPFTPTSAATTLQLESTLKFCAGSAHWKLPCKQLNWQLRFSFWPSICFFWATSTAFRRHCGDASNPRQGFKRLETFLLLLGQIRSCAWY